MLARKWGKHICHNDKYTPVKGTIRCWKVKRSPNLNGNIFKTILKQGIREKIFEEGGGIVTAAASLWTSSVWHCDGSMWITTGKHCFFLNFVSRNFKYLILQVCVWRTGESEKHVDSHCPARISWVGVYSVLLVKGDEVSHVYTGTGELLPGLSSVFKAMRWRIHPMSIVEPLLLSPPW